MAEEELCPPPSSETDFSSEKSVSVSDDSSSSLRTKLFSLFLGQVASGLLVGSSICLDQLRDRGWQDHPTLQSTLLYLLLFILYGILLLAFGRNEKMNVRRLFALTPLFLLLAFAVFDVEGNFLVCLGWSFNNSSPAVLTLAGSCNIYAVTK